MFKSKGEYTTILAGEQLGARPTLAAAKALAVEHAEDRKDPHPPKKWTWQDVDGVKEYYSRDHDYTIKVSAA